MICVFLPLPQQKTCQKVAPPQKVRRINRPPLFFVDRPSFSVTQLQDDVALLKGTGAQVLYLKAFFVACDTVDGRSPANHLGCVKTLNSGINYLSTGAGLFPSTVS